MLICLKKSVLVISLERLTPEMTIFSFFAENSSDIHTKTQKRKSPKKADHQKSLK